MIAALLPLISRLTKQRADKLDNLDAAVTTRSTDASVWNHPIRTLTESYTPAISNEGANFRIFTSSGIFTVPSNVYKIFVICVGGGGAANMNPSLYAAVGGGGGGGYCQKVLSVTPGTSFPVVVGGVGGTSSFNDTTLYATGGLPGSTVPRPFNDYSGATAPGGAGGMGYGGDINTQGGTGGSGFTVTDNPIVQYGTGGASGTRYGNGGNGKSPHSLSSSSFRYMGGQIAVHPALVNQVTFCVGRTVNSLAGYCMELHKPDIFSGIPFGPFNTHYGNGLPSISFSDSSEENYFSYTTSSYIEQDYPSTRYKVSVKLFGGGLATYQKDDITITTQGMVVVQW